MARNKALASLPVVYVRSVLSASEARRRIVVTLTCNHAKTLRWWPGEDAPYKTRCAECRKEVGK